MKIEEAVVVLKQLKEQSQKHKENYTPIGSNLSPVLKIMQDTYQENIDAFDMAIEALETIEKGVVPVDWHNDVYETIQNRYFDLLEKTRWIPVSERLPTEQDANSKGKIVAWCTSFNGTEVELNWRLIETDGVVTHWRVGMEPPEQEV